MRISVRNEASVTLLCISRPVVYGLILSLSDSFVGSDAEARSGTTILLAGAHFAYVGARCIDQTAR
jgi:hypothetical protein